ncbi:DUF2911 domain-containing protein [Jiulongibacter sediminis]|uniref:DUF2911 domain-containing protein n=1 Tax=Jiulongibacter sediminis TaxID=1605367 RepID=A0A0P7C4V9_9BACT|nr:DUF2911 domain-containing protein [Jiulongibacter sediminis]KPM48299.1 hypothetical protein AFM12_06495 [Jiulongibacter sediminis]TBX24838.1 hypothetical protein TK44_06500 [Jiulongibacter sediminis]
MPKLLKILLAIAAVLVVLFFVFKNWTKSHSPGTSTELTSGDLSVKVTYCQPAVKGRVIFGELVPYDQVWRTGANEATLINFSRDVDFAGASVPAGEYTLWTIPTPGDWTIILNKQTGQWGTNYSEEDDLIRVEVPAEQTSESREMFTISMSLGTEDEVIMNLNWDKTSVDVPIK